jgi:DNA-binding NarL/FixJ family response regulator
MNSQVRAIVSSGYSSDPVIAQYRAHGFLGVVPKPYDLTELMKVIHAVMQGGKT